MTIIRIRTAFLSLWLMWTSGHAQPADRPCAYRSYVADMAAARQAMTNHKPQDAARRFRTAFRRQVFPLGPDLALALNLAVQLGDSSWAADLTGRLARGGIPPAYFSRFDPQAVYPAIRKACLTQPDIRIRDTIMLKEFLEIVRLDSLYNDRYHQWRNGDYPMTLEEMTAGAKAISARFHELVNSRGFPSEERMGYLWLGDQVLSYPILPLMMHLYQRGDPAFRDRLSIIACDGKLTPAQIRILEGTTGFCPGEGIDREMETRYRKYEHVSDPDK